MTDASEEKKNPQFSSVCFFLFPLLRSLELALKTCVLLNVDMLNPQELGSWNDCLNFMALNFMASLCQYSNS